MFCIDNLSGDELSISFYTGIVMTRMNLVIQYLRFQLFREKLYRPLRMFCRCLPWMIFLWMILPLDACSSSVKILQTAAVSFAVKCAMQISKELWWCMSTLIFLPPRPFLISLSRKCSEQTFVPSVWISFQLFESSAAIELEGLDLSENWRSRLSFRSRLRFLSGCKEEHSN